MKKLIILLTILITIIFILSAFSSCKKKNSEITLSEAPVGGNFTLRSDKGSFSLSDIKGNAVLIYFGFTFCPDVCPTTLSSVASAFKKLPPDEQSKVRLLFVDVDPERDSMERLKEYTSFFHPQFIPLTGTIPEIKKTAKLYGASFHKEAINSSMKYTMDHTASLFVVDRDGKWVNTIPHGASSEEIAAVLKGLLKTTK